MPQCVLDLWKPRTQQICPGEALCGIAVPTSCPDLLQGQDLLWFVDNEAACSSLIRGHSSEGDVHVIAHTSTILLTKLNSRAWYEWVDSHSNLSDGLSRLGFDDPWTLAQGWSLSAFELPAWVCQPQAVESLWLSMP